MLLRCSCAIVAQILRHRTPKQCICRGIIMLLFVNVCMMLNLMIGRYCVVIALGNMKTTELQNLYFIISYAPTIRLVADD